MLRLDQALVERGICESREKARRAVMAGLVRVNERVARKASESVKPSDQLTVTQAEKFVSRGGLKLEHGLEHFKVETEGRVAIDVGASTGGFTDCLLQRGAAKVYAVDVGKGQIAWKLRQDERVVVMEEVNARNLTREEFERRTSNVQQQMSNKIPPHPGPLPQGEGELQPVSRQGRRQGSLAAGGASGRLMPGLHTYPDLAVMDCSFISLRKIIPAVVALLREQATIVALIKPQFEAGKREASRGAGVIRDPAVHERILRELQEFVAAIPGLQWRGTTPSPILGPAGNQEFLVLIEKTG